MPNEWGDHAANEWGDVPVAATPASGGEEPKGAFSRFVDSVTSQLPTPSAIMGGIKEWWNRPEEIGKAMDALHVLNKAASLPENKGKPPAQWKSPPLTDAENEVVERGLHANLPGADNAQHPALQPTTTATAQALQGDLAGAGGSLFGGYVVPATIAATAPVVAKYARPVVRAGVEAVKEGGSDVAVGSGKIAAGGALLKWGPSDVADAFGAYQLGKMGAKQLIEGIKSGYSAGKLSLDQSLRAMSRVSAGERVPIWAQGPQKPADIPSGPADPTIAPRPSARPVGGPAIDTTSGEIVTKEAPGPVQTAEFAAKPEATAEALTRGQGTQLWRHLEYLAKQKGLGHDGLSDVMGEKFGITTTKDATPDMAKALYKDWTGEEWNPEASPEMKPRTGPITWGTGDDAKLANTLLQGGITAEDAAKMDPSQRALAAQILGEGRGTPTVKMWGSVVDKMRRNAKAVETAQQLADEMKK